VPHKESNDGDEHECQPREGVSDQKEGPNDAGTILQIPVEILSQPIVHLLHICRSVRTPTSEGLMLGKSYLWTSCSKYVLSMSIEHVDESLIIDHLLGYDHAMRSDFALRETRHQGTLRMRHDSRQ
jgi:hypothetical protein